MARRPRRRMSAQVGPARGDARLAQGGSQDERGGAFQVDCRADRDGEGPVCGEGVPEVSVGQGPSAKRKRGSREEAKEFTRIAFGSRWKSTRNTLRPRPTRNASSRNSNYPTPKSRLVPAWRLRLPSDLSAGTPTSCTRTTPNPCFSPCRKSCADSTLISERSGRWVRPLVSPFLLILTTPG